MDPPESIKQLCTVGVCTLWSAASLCCAPQVYVNCASLHLTASWKGQKIPSCYQQLVLKALERVAIQSFALCFCTQTLNYLPLFHRSPQLRRLISKPSL